MIGKQQDNILYINQSSLLTIGLPSIQIWPSVRPSVHILRYRLNVFLHQLPKVQSATFLDIQNTWGKVVTRNGLRVEIFCFEIV